MKAISGSHALPTNIVPAWNTARMHEMVERLERDKIAAEGDSLRGMGPVHFSHIDFRGMMRSSVEKFAAALIQRGPRRHSLDWRHAGRRS
ncbi:MAG: Tn3 family transposase [Burkholderiaceae bacterium]|nr:Tn3 family transposase [Burkholderiaceae bacterium]